MQMETAIKNLIQNNITTIASNWNTYLIKFGTFPKLEATPLLFSRWSITLKLDLVCFGGNQRHLFIMTKLDLNLPTNHGWSTNQPNVVGTPKYIQNSNFKFKFKFKI